MTIDQSAYIERQEHILNSAADLIIRLGYDKTSMNDIADAAGVTRAILYIHFKNKNALFETLLFREIREYNRNWLNIIETDPEIRTIGQVFKGVLKAVNQSPFIAALMRRDRQVFGDYLKQPGNIFKPLQSGALGEPVLRSLQEAGVVRKDGNPAVLAYLMNTLSAGLVYSSDKRAGPDKPTFDELMEEISILMDRWLTPMDPEQKVSGHEIFLRLANEMHTQFEKLEASFTKNNRTI